MEKLTFPVGVWRAIVQDLKLRNLPPGTMVTVESEEDSGEIRIIALIESEVD